MLYNNLKTIKLYLDGEASPNGVTDQQPIFPGHTGDAKVDSSATTAAQSVQHIEWAFLQILGFFITVVSVYINIFLSHSILYIAW